jgi:hypothetical protein
MTRKIISAAVILVTAAAAFAMTEIDSDGDNMLSMDELQAAYPDMTEAQFGDADTDADGMISEEELANARTAGLIPEDQG